MSEYPPTGSDVFTLRGTGSLFRPKLTPDALSRYGGTVASRWFSGRATRLSNARLLHLLGLATLLTAFALLVVVVAAAPATPNLAMFTAHLYDVPYFPDNECDIDIMYGTFGYCISFRSK
jgi:hypothetical protein